MPTANNNKKRQKDKHIVKSIVLFRREKIEALKRYAHEHGVSYSSIMRTLVDEFLAKHAAA